MAKGNFFSELKRRNVLRVGAAYAVASFAMIEVVSNVAPALSLPDWTLKLVIVLLALGFPGVVTFAWIYELTPEGLKRTEDVENKVSIAHQTGHRLNIVIIGLFVILAGVYGVERFLLTDKAADGAVRTSAEGAANQSTPEGISIAVLPFVNLSGDPGQEFFSDGMTEEITSALAKVRSLRVVGRTSAFEFKGQNKDLRAIGKALGASHLLEGSVRKEGSQIRVTGQLIKADDGTHIWTENYDRELKSVFAIQDEIAQAIAGALQAPLGLKAGESLVTSRAVSPDNYQQFLAAKAIVHGRGLGKSGSDLTAAIQLLEAVVADEPDFAPAFALLGYAYALLPGPGNFIFPGVPDNSRAIIQEYFGKAQSAASKAIQLDPKHVGGYLALAYAKAMGGQWAIAEDLFKQAVALDPNDPDVLHEYSVVLASVGKVPAALEMRERLLASDPLDMTYKIGAGGQLRSAGRPADSVRILEEVPAGFANRDLQLAQSYLAVGRFSEAADLLLAWDGSRPEDREQAAKFLRMAPKKLQDAAALPPLYHFSFVYLYVGAPDRALDYVERAAEVGHMITARGILEPQYSGLRKTARFKAILRKSGLVEYWRARGWPDMCRPVGADDFECS